MNRSIILLIFGLCFTSLLFHTSCNKTNEVGTKTYSFPDSLSAFNIYINEQALTHSDDYIEYSVATPLFSDYSEKQRLIRVPSNKKLKAVSDGLLIFPDSTILVKTFYYFKDKRNPSSEINIIETRILVLVDGFWNAATYKWLPNQKDAVLLNSGFDMAVNWINQSGSPQVISYRIPSKLECGYCHKNGDEIIPIGLKVRSLNYNITRDVTQINQLRYFINSNILEETNINQYSSLPVWNESSYTVEERARAYLDMNCAHCHKESGFANNSSLRMGYENSLDQSGIRRQKNAIEVLIKRGAMPLIGTTVIDKDGLKLVSEYLNSIQ